MDKIVTKIKSKKLHYVLKALKHFGDEEYMDFFLERETNPLLLEFSRNGCLLYTSPSPRDCS